MPVYINFKCCHLKAIYHSIFLLLTYKIAINFHIPFWCHDLRSLCSIPRSCVAETFGCILSFISHLLTFPSVQLDFNPVSSFKNHQAFRRVAPHLLVIRNAVDLNQTCQSSSHRWLALEWMCDTWDWGWGTFFSLKGNCKPKIINLT